MWTASVAEHAGAAKAWATAPSVASPRADVRREYSPRSSEETEDGQDQGRGGARAAPSATSLHLRGCGLAVSLSRGRTGVTAVCGTHQGSLSRPSACPYWLGAVGSSALAKRKEEKEERTKKPEELEQDDEYGMVMVEATGC